MMFHNRETVISSPQELSTEAIFCSAFGIQPGIVRQAKEKLASDTDTSSNNSINRTIYSPRGSSANASLKADYEYAMRNDPAMKNAYSGVVFRRPPLPSTRNGVEKAYFSEGNLSDRSHNENFARSPERHGNDSCSTVRNSLRTNEDIFRELSNNKESNSVTDPYIASFNRHNRFKINQGRPVASHSQISYEETASKDQRVRSSSNLRQPKSALRILGQESFVSNPFIYTNRNIEAERTELAKSNLSKPSVTDSRFKPAATHIKHLPFSYTQPNEVSNRKGFITQSHTGSTLGTQPEHLIGPPVIGTLSNRPTLQLLFPSRTSTSGHLLDQPKSGDDIPYLDRNSKVNSDPLGVSQQQITNTLNSRLTKESSSQQEPIPNHWSNQSNEKAFSTNTQIFGRTSNSHRACRTQFLNDQTHTPASLPETYNSVQPTYANYHRLHGRPSSQQPQIRGFNEHHKLQQLNQENNATTSSKTQGLRRSRSLGVHQPNRIANKMERRMGESPVVLETCRFPEASWWTYPYFPKNNSRHLEQDNGAISTNAPMYSCVKKDNLQNQTPNKPQTYSNVESPKADTIKPPGPDSYHSRPDFRSSPKTPDAINTVRKQNDRSVNNFNPSFPKPHWCPHNNHDTNSQVLNKLQPDNTLRAVFHQQPSQNEQFKEGNLNTEREKPDNCVPKTSSLRRSYSFHAPKDVQNSSMKDIPERGYSQSPKRSFPLYPAQPMYPNTDSKTKESNEVKQNCSAENCMERQLSSQTPIEFGTADKTIKSTEGDTAKVNINKTMESFDSNQLMRSPTLSRSSSVRNSNNSISRRPEYTELTQKLEEQFRASTSLIRAKPIVAVSPEVKSKDPEPESQLSKAQPLISEPCNKDDCAPTVKASNSRPQSFVVTDDTVHPMQKQLMLELTKKLAKRTESVEEPQSRSNTPQPSVQNSTAAETVTRIPTPVPPSASNEAKTKSPFPAPWAVEPPKSEVETPATLTEQKISKEAAPSILPATINKGPVSSLFTPAPYLRPAIVPNRVGKPQLPSTPPINETTETGPVANPNVKTRAPPWRNRVIFPPDDQLTTTHDYEVDSRQSSPALFMGGGRRIAKNGDLKMYMSNIDDTSDTASTCSAGVEPLRRSRKQYPRPRMPITGDSGPPPTTNPLLRQSLTATRPVQYPQYSVPNPMNYRGTSKGFRQVTCHPSAPRDLRDQALHLECLTQRQNRSQPQEVRNFHGSRIL